MSGCFSWRTAATGHLVFFAFVIREEIPPPLPVSGPTDGLQELTRQHCVVITPGHSFVLLFAAGGGHALSGGPFRVGNSLPKFHAPRDPDPDLSGPADTQRLHKNDVRVPTPIENPPHSKAKIAVKNIPTAPEGVVYLLAD